jgi:hypothetical protein
MFRKIVLPSGLFVGYWFGLRAWFLRWGASDEELAATYPGDEILAEGKTSVTRAITVEAPPSAIWPWLLQIGQGRGGFYSYDWLENLLGLDIHTLETIVPELQALEEGDFISFAKNTPGGMFVAQMIPERALVLQAADPDTRGPVDHAAQTYLDATWAFILEEIDEGVTRLITRFRAEGKPDVGAAAFGALIELPHFIMERKMLLTLKRLAEGRVREG